MRFQFEDRGILIENNRQPLIEVDPMFPQRWSPRAFSPEPIPEEALQILFEAARWAPSCYNEQPWLFLYASKEKEKAQFLKILVDQNQTWAKNAPVLAFLFARRNFSRNNKANLWAAFDCGAAWMSLALQARTMGLYAHGMAGYHHDMAYDLLNMSKEEYEVICAIAIGSYGDIKDVPSSVAAMEKPNDRKPLEEVARRWKP